MNNRKIFKKSESSYKESAKKVETQVQIAFLNMLYEQGVLSDKVCTLAMRRITEGA